MKNLILFLFGNVAILICAILNKFIKFRISVLASSRIGHLITNFELILLLAPKNTLIFIGLQSTVANNFVLNFYKKHKNIFFSRFFAYLYHSIFYVNPNSSLLITWTKFNPEFSFQMKHEIKIKLPYYSNNKVNEIISKFNINKNFVGLHARNNLYVEKYTPEDKNFHDYRNFNFDDFSLVIEHLKKKNNSIIKLGETFSEENLKNFQTKIFTSIDFESNEEVDYLLNKYSRYNVVGNTGVSSFSSMHRKKTVYINFIPFNLNHLSKCSPGSLILPKKIYNKKEERFLSFKEVNSINFDIHSDDDPYDKYNLTVINNSPQEILDAVIEMEEILLKKNNDESIELNDLFWKRITDNNSEEINYLKNEIKLSISTQFLKNNQNLYD